MRARWMMVLALSAFAHRASAQDFRVKVTLPGGNRLPIALDTIGAPYELDFPKSKVFSAFSEAFTDLEIPIENRDYSLGVIGNATLQIRAFFAGSQLSRYAECGLGATGPNANSWKVHMAVIAFIDSIGPTKTRVRVAMTAGAADPAGATKESTMCGTTGVLEDKLSARAAKRLQ